MAKAKIFKPLFKKKIPNHHRQDVQEILLFKKWNKSKKEQKKGTTDTKTANK